jgi:nitroreductase
MMDTDHPAPELMRRRKTVRTYAQRPLPAPLLDAFQAALEAARRGPLGSRCRFALFDVRGPAGRELAPMGTYGLIRGARYFFSGAVKRGETDLEDFGYLFETLVLKATDMGLATCWLGASFDRSGYGRLLDAAPDERVPAASPLGLATGKANPVDAAIRLAAGSKRRKALEELFFDGDFEHPLNPVDAGAAALCLEMVRLAPSARNRQPWRLLREGKRFHFFLARSGPARDALDLARVDLGIAMCHFDLTARYLGLAGGFAAERPPRATGALATGALATGAPEYIITWKGNIS